jgi:hypothetical protein
VLRNITGCAGRQIRRIDAAHDFQIFFESLHFFNFKTDMVETRSTVFRFVIVFDFPGREHQRYLAVREVKIWILQSLFFLFELEDIDIEASQSFGVNGTDCHMLDVSVLLPLPLAPNASNVLLTRLRQVK